MTAPHSAMILAAGFGTRMGALTADQPKPLLPVAGRPLIDHALDHVAQAGLRRAIVNLHYRGDQIRAHLAGRKTPEIAFSDEQPQILDTGGGVVQAIPLLGDAPFVTCNSDAVFLGSNPLQVLLEAWDQSAHDALLLFVPVTQAIAYTRAGDFFVGEDGATPVRRGVAASAPFIFAGAQIIRPEVFENAPDGPFSMNLIWDRLLEDGRLAAVSYPGRWIDVGTPDGLAEADAALAAGAT
ncbi:MAG: nucleotidyltransferase family protein [Pseudomonadota bacterium]